MLYASCKAEVNARMRKFMLSDKYKQHLWDISKWLTSTDCTFGLFLSGFVIITAKELVQYAKAFANPTKENAEAVAYFNKIRNIEVLCIDDLGAEPRESLHYGEIITAVTDIIHYRYQEQFCTIATSNLSGKEIGKYYDARLADRLREMAHIVNFGNEPSFRIKAYE